jgi:hypothetical protein
MGNSLQNDWTIKKLELKKARAENDVLAARNRNYSLKFRFINTKLAVQPIILW